MKTFKLLSGEEIDVGKREAIVEEFFRRVIAALKDPDVSDDDMIALIYGRENPILDQTIFDSRGAVTKAVFADPAYHVLLDMLDQKRVQRGKLDPQKAEARYTLTVAEAAAQLGVHESAVRQAIAAKRLPAWKKGARYLLAAQDIANYKPTNRGPERSPAGGPLVVRLGSAPGVSFRVKHAAGDLGRARGAGGAIDMTIPSWRKVAVIGGKGPRSRFWELEPGPDEKEIDWDGYYVRGRFTIVRGVTDPVLAREAFKDFRPS